MAVSPSSAMAARAGPGAGALLLASIVLGYGAGHLALGLGASPDATPQIRAAQSAAETPRAGADGRQENRSWAPVFGTATPEPEPEAPQSAPEPARDYRLQGLMARPEGGWAVLDDGRAQRIVRVGDTLPGGETVARISAGQVLLDTQSGQRVVTFEEAGQGAELLDRESGNDR